MKKSQGWLWVPTEALQNARIGLPIAQQATMGGAGGHWMCLGCGWEYASRGPEHGCVFCPTASSRPQ